MAIELRDLHFSYLSKPEKNTPIKRVLDIDHWQIAKGEQVFVQGPSGCGKSTLLNLISGMLPIKNQGEVRVLGERLDKMSARQRDAFRANHIGYVFQQFNLIPYLNVIDNIRLAGHFSKTKKGASQQKDIQDLLSSLNVLDSEWQRPTSELSIGQQQRVAIARALINKPELLIADEPTSSLDQHNRDNFMSLLMPLVKDQQTTLLFVSHDMSLASYFPSVDALAEINQAVSQVQASQTLQDKGMH